MRILSTAAALALGALLASPAGAEPSAKHAFAYRKTAVIGEGAATPLLTQTIKTANEKGLAVTVSLECQLLLKNVTKSKGVAGTDNKASVKVSVYVDDELAAPGEVTFCSRSTKTSAAFAGIFTQPDNATCFVVEELDTTGDGSIVTIAPDCLTPEEYELIEDSTNAHSYVFYYDGSDPGDHTVTVKAAIDESTGVARERAGAPRASNGPPPSSRWRRAFAFQARGPAHGAIEHALVILALVARGRARAPTG